MAVSPVILNRLPFDAELDFKLQFTYSGSQIYGYGVIIEDNATNQHVTTIEVKEQLNVVKDAVALIPANTLVNGKAYNFRIYVFDHTGVEPSPESNTVVLKCLKTPVFTFSNVIQNMVVENSYMDVSISYYQENGELLNLYTVLLYSNEKNLIWSSGSQYADTPFISVTDLMDDATYYIKATGETVNGVEIETEMFQFSCNYIKPDLFLKFRADNIPEEGSVRLSFDFVLIEGKSIPNELIYIDDEKVSLINGEKVYFDEGFTANNFIGEIKVSNIPDFTRVVSLNMKTANCYITWNWGYVIGYDDPMYYAELTAYSPMGYERLNSIIRSNYIPALEEDQQLFVWFKHLNGMFDLKIEALPIEEINGEAVEIDEGGDA